ncbi:Mitochondrial pyruvate carrier 4 [Ananas comosus]|uniref:Mitochondrial pyruvate carrier n=1 Tax=Ananas comosus TaxID=4615 RepID=A0A199VUH8_ANACO|nr:Mitochondrial pyruvate carrier 4 [Ananas comosus]
MMGERRWVPVPTREPNGQDWVICRLGATGSSPASGSSVSGAPAAGGTANGGGMALALASGGRWRWRYGNKPSLHSCCSGLVSLSGHNNGRDSRERKKEESEWRVHFWAPTFKWGISIANIADFSKPPEKISYPQQIVKITSSRHKRHPWKDEYDDDDHLARMFMRTYNFVKRLLLGKFNVWKSST